MFTPIAFSVGQLVILWTAVILASELIDQDSTTQERWNRVQETVNGWTAV